MLDGAGSTARGQGPTSEGPSPAGGWRKRHPVASRLLLYGLGLALFAGLFFAWNRRRAEDADAVLRAERMKLENLVLLLPRGGDSASMKARAEVYLNILDTEYAIEAQHASLLPLRARMRALGLRAAGRHEEAAALLVGLDAEALPSDEQVALGLERVEARLDASQGEAALADVRSLAGLLRDRPVAALLARSLEARALEAAGDREGAAALLAQARLDLGASLPAVPKLSLAGHDWSLGEALVSAVRAESAWGADPQAPWLHVLAVAGDDARLVLEAAAALARLGASEAGEALERGARLDETLALSFAQSEPALAALPRGAELLLKSAAPARR